MLSNSFFNFIFYLTLLLARKVNIYISYMLNQQRTHCTQSRSICHVVWISTRPIMQSNREATTFEATTNNTLTVVGVKAADCSRTKRKHTRLSAPVSESDLKVFHSRLRARQWPNAVQVTRGTPQWKQWNNEWSQVMRQSVTALAVALRSAESLRSARWVFTCASHAVIDAEFSALINRVRQSVVKRRLCTQRPIYLVIKIWLWLFLALIVFNDRFRQPQAPFNLNSSMPFSRWMSPCRNWVSNWWRRN